MRVLLRRALAHECPYLSGVASAWIFLREVLVQDAPEHVFRRTCVEIKILQRFVLLHAIDATPAHPTHWLISTQRRTHQLEGFELG